MKDFNENCFGIFISSKITKRNCWFKDSNAFIFSFKNDSFITFELKEKNKNVFYLHSKESLSLFEIGNGDMDISKENFPSTICIDDYNYNFNYKNNVALINGCSGSNQRFYISKIIVIQLE